MTVKSVIYTEDSRAINSQDVSYWGIAGAGNSVVLPTTATALDFNIPMGKVFLLRGLSWCDNPMVYVPQDDNIRVRLWINGTARGLFGGSASFTTNFPIGFKQNSIIPTFVKVDQGSIITLAFLSQSALTFTKLEWKIFGVLANATGAPINEEFSNTSISV